MTIDEKYMMRCFQLANKGKGSTMPNPLVGAAIVDKGEIIGEGYHRQYGCAHAEVNAINAVVNKSRLATSTIYVSLEPCSHYGKTPPCAELIVKSGIPKVVIAVTDPNPAVAGKGIKILEDAGIEVVVGVLSEMASIQNRVFFVNQNYERPFIILKWAQSKDGFIDGIRSIDDEKSAVRLSSTITSAFVHKLRTEVQAIMVGTNTALLDNPQLTSRNWFGKNPTRIVVDRDGRLPESLSVFDGETDTIFFTEKQDYIKEGRGFKFVNIDFSVDIVPQIMKYLYKEGFYSLLVEGGSKLLSSFIAKNYWDEAYIEVSPIEIIEGVEAPSINLSNSIVKHYDNSIQYHLKNKITQNIN